MYISEIMPLCMTSHKSPPNWTDWLTFQNFWFAFVTINNNKESRFIMASY